MTRLSHRTFGNARPPASRSVQPRRLGVGIVPRLVRDQIDRRSFLRGAGLGAGALVLGGRAVWPDPALTRRRRVPFARAGAFREGVGAGEPTTRGATIWTRLGGYRGDRRLAVEVARDPGFDRILLRKEVR